MLLAESKNVIIGFGVTERKEHRLWGHIKVGFNLHSATCWLTLSKLINFQISGSSSINTGMTIPTLHVLCEY